nr:nucleotide-binding alpha-beta plait domain-containing protein [Tanacetum cinerariifolium]
MGYRRSVQDEVLKVSISVFIKNIPDQAGAKELWNACKQYGHVVDAFIPDRRSKIGKRFGFVRFIKVFDAERLVNNLCMVWIGRHRLHANIARFPRPTGQNSSRNFGHNGEKRKDDKGNNENFNSYAHVLKGVSHPNGDPTNTPSLVIGDDCVNQEDYSCCLNGKVKEFGSLSNLKVVLGNEGFNEIGIRYLGGLWVMLVFRLVDGKEKSKGKTFWVRAKEVPGWSPEFEEQLDEDIEPEDDIFGGVDKPNTYNSDEEFKDENVVPDTVFDDGSVKPSVVKNSSGNQGASNQGDHVNAGIDNSYSKREGTESVGSGCFKKGDALHTGGSILTVMDELIKVGQTMGFKMDGCMKNIEEIIESQGVNEGSVHLLNSARVQASVTHEVGSGSGSGGGGDDEPCKDEDAGEDEDADGDEDS